MGRTPTWNNSTIQILRVPQVFGSILKRIARDLDTLEPDQELIFVYRLKSSQILRTKGFHDAGEMIIKVTEGSNSSGVHPSVAAIASEDLLLPSDKGLNDSEPSDLETESSYELDLSALVDELEAVEEAQEVVALFDADAFVNQLETIDQAFDFDEDDAHALQEIEPEADMDAWQTAIGSVELASSDHIPAVARPEEAGLLDLSELSTLFAASEARNFDFDPDAVIELALVSEETPLDDFDPDAVIESVAAQTLATEANQHDDRQSIEALAATAPLELNAPDPDDVIAVIKAEASEHKVSQQPTNEVVTTTTGSTMSEPHDKPTAVIEAEPVSFHLPQVTIPRLIPINQSFFASQLFATWQRLAIQKLLEQKRPGAEPWGVAVELNEIYQAQFSAMLGNHFLQRVQDVVLSPSGGNRIQLIATPGIVNQKIAGVDANAISYKIEHNRQSQVRQGEHGRVLPAMTSLQALEAKQMSTQAVLEPSLDGDLARLLEERQRRITASNQPKVKRQNWFKQLFTN